MGERWIHSPGVAWERFRDEVVILAASGRKIVRLNAVGSWVWACCDGRTTLDELARKIARRWDRSTEQVAGELRAFCEELAARGLLSAAPAMIAIPVRKTGAGRLVAVAGPYVLPMVADEKGAGNGGRRDRVSPRSVTGLP
ncbi:MAG: PqqD family protein [Planctomycetes bacterium]|nr:PqqD family protein [Planctomycetota bacterium]